MSYVQVSEEDQSLADEISVSRVAILLMKLLSKVHAMYYSRETSEVLLVQPVSKCTWTYMYMTLYCSVRV